VVEAVAWQEFRYNQAAVSPKGARGGDAADARHRTSASASIRRT
jgi:soluble lytic murein transglycosylase-like protein